jgi:RND family efflux transporter MFP subunit
MKVGRLIGWTALVATAGVVAAMAWPDSVDRLAPGLGARAVALRAALPDSLAARLGHAPKPAEPAAGKDGGKGGGPQRPPVSVVLAPVEAKAMPVRLDAIGSVQPAATVVVRSRVDSQIDQILVADGAAVKEGDVIAKLDSRAIEAQIRQAEATLAKDRATREQAERDAARLADLLARGSGTQIAADNAKTAVQSARAVASADQAALDNLRVQFGFYTVKAPISGRIGVVSQKAGNIARQGEAANALATINQISPIYVAFSLPQRFLPELRDAMASGEARAVATPQGATKSAEGKVAVLDNAIDAATGTITVRAIFDNADEMLWPGQFCNVRVVLRVEQNAVVVPREAVQVGQNGNFVFVADDNKTAQMRKVAVGRYLDDEAVIASGLKVGEKVVVDGQAMLAPNAPIAPRPRAQAQGAGDPQQKPAKKPDGA